jgi:FkbM family methyltransferase
MLPHDDNFNECDSQSPPPPFVGIWKERFDLSRDPKVIVDIGGNRGDDISFFLQRHPKAHIFTFEPLPVMAKFLQKRFEQHSNVIINNFGVSDAESKADFVLGEEGDFVGATGKDHTIKGKHVQVEMRDIDKVLKWVQGQTGQVPDLLSMNCEGCEYRTMQRLAEKGWLEKIPFVELSWHRASDVQNRVAKRCAVEKVLSGSHKRFFRSNFGWVGWQAKHVPEIK